MQRVKEVTYAKSQSNMCKDFTDKVTYAQTLGTKYHVQRIKVTYAKIQSNIYAKLHNIQHRVSS